MSYNDDSLLPPTLFLKIGGWRQPTIMVDKIIDFVPGLKGSITIIKHITYNDTYLLGHFPTDPVMPGVMVAEIFGQTSEYFSFINDFCDLYQEKTNIKLKTFTDISKAINEPMSEEILITHRARVQGFLVSQNLKYKNKAYPGDTIEVKSSLLLPEEIHFKHYSVEARVGKRIIANGTIVNYRDDGLLK